MQPRARFIPVLSLVFASLLILPGSAHTPPGFDVEVLVEGQPRPEYSARGTRYVEAVRGKEYAVRLRNPLGVRVAVALSVDGLNTIDARHGSANDARKWVLEPYETVVIDGWQTTMEHARRFYFTSEERSYAQWLGKTNDMGVISAVFFRERPRVTVRPTTEDRDRKSSARSEMPPAPAAESSTVGQPAPAPQAKADVAVTKEDDYAATGIGRRTDHPVTAVHLDLDPLPVASIDLRYEYRAQLVRLGVLPPTADRDALARRERARGFDRFCPEP